MAGSASRSRNWLIDLAFAIVHHAEAAGAEDVVADYALVAARRAAALASNREAYSHYRRASAFVDRLPTPEQATVLEELATAAYVVGRLEESFRGDRARDRHLRGPGSTQADVGRCTPRHVAVPLVRGRRRACAGEGDRGDRDPRAARRVGRARPGLQRRVAARDARRGRRAGALVGTAGARARAAARRREHARARPRQPRLRQASPGSPRNSRDSSKRTPSRTPPGIAKMQPARSGNLGYVLMSWARPEPALRYARAGARLRGGVRGAHVRLVRDHDARLAAACGRASGTRPSESRGARSSGASPSSSCTRRPSWPSWPFVGAIRTRPSWLADLAAAGRAHRRASADRAVARAGDRAGR